MKLFALAIAATNAQLDFPDLGEFDLSAFGLGPDAFNVPIAAAPAAPADEERYFFTVVPVVTTTPNTPAPTTTVQSGQKCWKCDAMTYASCASTGYYETCPLGDLDCCFVEVREQQQQLQQLCTGCKDKTACEDNKAENFIGSLTLHHQCRPDYRQQRIGRRGPQQSTCRQCFSKCEGTASDVKMCFGNMPHTGNTAGNEFANKLFTNRAKYPWGQIGVGSVADQTGVYGIPTGFMADSGVDSTIIGLINNVQSTPDNLVNIYFNNNSDGKTAVSNGDSTRDAAEMTFWGLQGAGQTWWSSNLKSIQTKLYGKTATPVGADFQ